MLRTAELDAVLQVGSHVGREEGQSPAAHAALDAVGSLGCECTIPGHVQPLTHEQKVRFAFGIRILLPRWKVGFPLTQFKTSC